MKVPTGQGVWMAFPSMLHLPPLALATLLHLSGFDWCAPRGGDGGNEDHSWTAEHTRACNAVGVKVYRWNFSRPTTWRKELACAVRWKSEGDAGYIIDAETPWEVGDNRAAASAYVQTARAELGDYFLADAPWPYVSYHAPFPFKEFGAGVDARMPQNYWTEISRHGAAYHLPRIDAEWERYQKAAGERAIYMPIGITYGAAELKKWGSPQLPPGEITPEDVEYFDDRYRLTTRSYYSLEASSDAVRKKLVELCAGTREVVPGFENQPATMLGAEARREWDAADRTPTTGLERDSGGPENVVVPTHSERVAALAPAARADVLAVLRRNAGRYGGENST